MNHASILTYTGGVGVGGTRKIGQVLRTASHTPLKKRRHENYSCESPSRRYYGRFGRASWREGGSTSLAFRDNFARGAPHRRRYL